MLHQVAHWNWFGLGFVTGMMAMVGMAGCVTNWLQRWAERGDCDAWEPGSEREVHHNV